MKKANKAQKKKKKMGKEELKKYSGGSLSAGDVPRPLAPRGRGSG